MLDSLRQDVVFAFRLLRRNPRNTVFAVLILGLGIGANTAMFSAVSYVLIHPLPFRDTEHTLRIRNTVVATDGQTHPYNMRARDILALKTVGSVFDGIVAFSGENLTLSGGDLPERLSVVFQTAGAETVLGVPPAFGRSFTPEEERQGLTAGVALISDAFWASHFGRISSAIGSTLRLDGRPFTVIGVMPPQYAFPYEAQVWIPFALDAGDSTRDFAVFGCPAAARTRTCAARSISPPRTSAGGTATCLRATGFRSSQSATRSSATRRRRSWPSPRLSGSCSLSRR
jgi:putative ABC transport system permease protein